MNASHRTTGIAVSRPVRSPPRTPGGIRGSNPELQERELIKLHKLAEGIKGVLLRRGVSENAAVLAAQSGVTVFHEAFARWVRQDDPAAFRPLLDKSLEELRSVTATPDSGDRPDLASHRALDQGVPVENEARRRC